MPRRGGKWSSSVRTAMDEPGARTADVEDVRPSQAFRSAQALSDSVSSASAHTS